MDPDYAQRRRVAVALAITIIAVPAVVLLNRGNDATDTEPRPTVVGTAPAEAALTADGMTNDAVATTIGEPSVTDAMGTAAIDAEAGLDEPVIDEQARIAIPRLPQAIEGTATFRSDIRRLTECQVDGVPFNTQVTITNLDNSRSVRCVTLVRGEVTDEDVVLHTDAFRQIADITDTPIPVRITW